MEAFTRFKSFSALFILAAAALIAQSGTMPGWGENLLSCGFTHALRTIKSVETVASASDACGGYLSNRSGYWEYAEDGGLMSYGI